MMWCNVLHLSSLLTSSRGHVDRAKLIAVSRCPRWLFTRVVRSIYRDSVFYATLGCSVWEVVIVCRSVRNAERVWLQYIKLWVISRFGTKYEKKIDRFHNGDQRWREWSWLACLSTRYSTCHPFAAKCMTKAQMQRNATPWFPQAAVHGVIASNWRDFPQDVKIASSSGARVSASNKETWLCGVRLSNHVAGPFWLAGWNIENLQERRIKHGTSITWEVRLCGGDELKGEK